MSLSPQELDIAANRRAAKYTRGELALRVLWGLAKPLYRWSPRPCFAWRRWLLRRFGAQVGDQAHLYASAVIYYPWMLTVGEGAAVGEDALIYNLGPIAIGARATISHRAHLCAGTHDHRDPALPLIRPPITVGPQAWVCADAFVGPGVTIGEGAVIGARAAVFKDVVAWEIVGGNPARRIAVRTLHSTPSPTGNQ